MTMKMVNISALLAEIEATGEKVLICRNGKPIADLLPHRPRGRRTPHPLMRQIRIDYDPTEPLTEDEWPEISPCFSIRVPCCG
jgi:antitoxin (DNA-binding transcriptional repressor) of toxin-antitoxin stability system